MSYMYRSDGQKKNATQVGEVRFVNTQSGQPVVIYMGLWGGIDTCFCLFTKVLFLSLCVVFGPYFEKHENSRHLMKQEKCIKGRR